MTLLRSRSSAGRGLAYALAGQVAGETPLVCAITRGGVPVAVEIANRLGAPLDVILTKKLPAPRNKDRALGAMAYGGAWAIDRLLANALRLRDEQLWEHFVRQGRSLEQTERLYRGSRPKPRLTGRRLILVDDGAESGMSARAALGLVALAQPARITLALPVAPRETATQLRALADEVICLDEPTPFVGIGQAYREFEEVTDFEVCRQLARTWYGQSTEQNDAQNSARSSSDQRLRRSADQAPRHRKRLSEVSAREWYAFCEEFTETYRGQLIGVTRAEHAPSSRPINDTPLPPTAAEAPRPRSQPLRRLSLIEHPRGRDILIEVGGDSHCVIYHAADISRMFHPVTPGAASLLVEAAARQIWRVRGTSPERSAY
ncbi:MAG: phosphoribosyltransferase family protein [Pseudomonadota bacterium]|nr:phosphoribosyltransferase family protein [Pseudomonadota bacterium]